MPNAMLSWFRYDHLPTGELREVSRLCSDLAHQIDADLKEGPEKTAGLRKLLEAKDCFVRQRVQDLSGAPGSKAPAELVEAAEARLREELEARAQALDEREKALLNRVDEIVTEARLGLVGADLVVAVSKEADAEEQGIREALADGTQLGEGAPGQPE